MNLPFLCNMALVTIRRSPSASCPLDATTIMNTDDSPDGEEEEESNKQRSIGECYFSLKGGVPAAAAGVAAVMPRNDSLHPKYRKSNAYSGDIQQHLQSMFCLLRPEDTLKMAVKLESIHSGRTRYLVVVSCSAANSNRRTESKERGEREEATRREEAREGEEECRRRRGTEESCLLGVDYNSRATIGLVLPLYADTQITLDGDGGFSVSSTGRHHIFKPVSVQAMWSALQTLHRASSKARECNYYMGGLTHSWIENYERKVESDRSCLNEWVAMDNLESRRPPSPDCLRSRPRERAITEKDIRLKLKEIMMTVDLDEVTSKFIRTRLEEELDMDLHEYKSFIDEEMITILGQMDAATQIFDFLYLGSEWNASNLEELQKNGVGHILNVTREIDNFFPGMFHYQNIRVYDDEGTELLKHWDTTYKFITSARENGSKVLVHCKMGVSRSASVVIAYVMKAHNWNMQKALTFVKELRTCVKPNQGFMKQLEVYQGILNASKHRHNQLWRSKSENNLKMQTDDGQESGTTPCHQPDDLVDKELLYLDMSTPAQSLGGLRSDILFPCHRPKSWSPDDNIADMLFSPVAQVTPTASTTSTLGTSETPCIPAEASTEVKSRNHVLLPCRDGKQYSVSPNKALHLAMPAPSTALFQLGSEDDESPVSDVGTIEHAANWGEDNDGEGACVVAQHRTPTVRRVGSIKDRINELETQAQLAAEIRVGPARDRLDLPAETGLVLNLAYQFEAVGSRSSPELSEDDGRPSSPRTPPDMRGNEPVVSHTKPPAARHKAVLVVRPETLADAEELVLPNAGTARLPQGKTMPRKVDARSLGVEVASGVTSPTVLSGRVSDPFSLQVDHVFDGEEKSGEATGAGIAERLGAHQARHDSWGSSDSAISLHLPEPRRESIRAEPLRSSRDSVEGGSCWDSHWERAVALKSSPVVDQAASSDAESVMGAVDEEHMLKRTHSTSSCDGSPRSLLRPQPCGRPSEVSMGPVKRSHSLRAPTTCHRHTVYTSPEGGCAARLLTRTRATLPPNLAYHPTPYRSPTENRDFQTFSMALPSFVAAVVPQQQQPPPPPPPSAHYASAPILFPVDVAEPAAAVGPFHSSSQPNMTCATVLPRPRRCPLYPAAAAGSSPPAATGHDVVPGIVKQNKEILECFINASLPPRSYSCMQPNPAAVSLRSQRHPPPPPPLPPPPPPPPPIRHSSLSEEWKLIQRRLRKLGRYPSGETDYELLPAVGGTEVRRIAEVIQRASGTKTVGITPDVRMGDAGHQAPTDKLVIVDKFGKEVPPTEEPSNATSMAVRTPSVARSMSDASPREEKSVRDLADIFKVSCGVNNQRSLRHRCFSENEATNLELNSGSATRMMDMANAPGGGSLRNQLSNNGGAERSLKKILCCHLGSEGSTSDTIPPERSRYADTVEMMAGGQVKSRPPLAVKSFGEVFSQTVALPKKVRKTQGKSHPLTKLSSCKQTHSTI